MDPGAGSPVRCAGRGPRIHLRIASLAATPVREHGRLASAGKSAGPMHPTLEIDMPFRPFTLACFLVALAACKPSAPAQGDSAAPAPSAAAPAGPLANAASALKPLASPLDELDASTALFLKARSYHAVMSMTGSRGMDNEIDFIAPDRYRMKMPGGMGTQVIIGDTMYMQVDGQALKVPMPEGTLTKMRDPMRMQEAREGMTVDAQGDDRVDGKAAKKYLVRHTKPVPGEFTLWIDSDGLPLQFIQQGEAQGKPYTMTMRYSRFNDPTITIEPPQ